MNSSMTNVSEGSGGDAGGRISLTALSDEKATVEHFGQIIPFLLESAVLVFGQHPGKVWEAVTGDRRVVTGLDLGPVGLWQVDQPIPRRQLRQPDAALI